MNYKRILALILALMSVLSLVACGGNETTGPSNGTEPTGNNSDPAGELVYTVKVLDVLGNPYTENMIILFKQNGEQVAMQPVNAEGVVSKKLPQGTYEVELQITKDAEKYYFDKANLVLTAETPSLEIVISGVCDDEVEVLMVNSLPRYVYKLTFTDGQDTFQLEDMRGDLGGTYRYAANEEGGYTVTDTDGNDVGMAIILNLDGSFSFLCDALSYEQPMEQEGEATETLSGTYKVASKEYEAPYVRTGCTYLELIGGERNFVIFTPLQSGIYEFTVHNADAAVGYYGSPYFVLPENGGESTGDHSVTVEVKDSMIGDGTAGTTQLVIGIDAGADMADCVLSIVRVADYTPTPEEMPWSIYESTYTPTKYTLPAGLTIQEFDLTASYTLVFNEADGFYHLNSADGPVVLVRMKDHANLIYGGSLGDILANTNVGAYFYNEDGSFLRKELYNDCLLQYLGTLNKGMGNYSYSGGMLDDNYGVYPLTKDLEYIIKNYGQRAGWWTVGGANYLFGALPNVNIDSAWLFMCCYAQ